MTKIRAEQVNGVPTGGGGGGGVSSGIYIQDEGNTLGLFNTINFHGPGITGSVTATASGIIADLYVTGGGTTGNQGPQGSPGVTGPAGAPQGSPGVTGAQGPQGSPGAPGTQGPQGSPGVTGTIGPQGLQGSPGVTGAPGVQGNQGSPGVTGAVGPQGNQGSPGVTGAQGIQGSPGITGAQGIQGDQGSPGVTGTQGPTGSIGPQGNQGSPGVTGAQGVQGNQGSPGVTGNAGQDAFNNTATFIQNNSNLVTVVSGAYAGWEQVGQAVYISTGGYYIVTGISGTNLVLANLASNLASGITINASKISPAGVVGPQGSPGITGAVGPQGNQGSPGITGSQGPTGSIGPQGNQGSPGVTGTQGPQGNQGSPGVTGTQGPQGSPGNVSGIYVLRESATLGIFNSINFHGPGVTSSATGNVADVYITGGSGTAGPQGIQGSPGVTGAAGPQGNQGSPGVTGSQGPTGSIGPQGNQGSPGVTGAQGPTGSQGLQGSPGVTGNAGQDAFNNTATFIQNNGNLVTVVSGAYAGWEQIGQAVFISTGGYYVVTGISGTNLVLVNLASNLASGTTVNASKISPAGVVGSIGPQGSPGVTGSQGIQGNQGSPGVTGSQGPTGSIGPQGNQGSPGVTGSQGIQGNQGSPGVTGSQGPTGSVGPQGNQGSPGVTGSQGPTGSVGPQGSPGVTGTQGPQGSPGVTGNAGQDAFNNTATYIQNNSNLVTVVSGAYAGWEQVGQAVFISTGGYYIVTGISGTNLVLANLASNVASGIIINASKISPAGIQGSIGPQGSPGVTGSQGIQGNQGSPGVTGSQGIQGNQGSPGVTGSQGIQGNQGSPGVTGSQGPTGSIGPQGNQGSPGVTGSQGPTGSIGPQGNQGSPGVTGVQGPTGSVGPQGSQGSPGVTGAQGIQGSPGVTGTQGPQGSPGVTGVAGQDAFNNTATFVQNNANLVTVVSGAYAGWEQIGQAVFISTGGYYVVTGISGTNLVLANLASNLASGITINASKISPGGIPGITGSQGNQGSPGVTGSQGPTGSIGPQGSQGSPGVTGSQGPTGSIGPQGNQGSPGVTGSQGPTGSVGPQGNQGSPGVTGTQGIQGSPGVTGAQGPQGSPGVTGNAGQDAFNNTATFIQNNGNLVTVVSGAYAGWEQLGQAVYISTGGYYIVTGISGTNLVLANLVSNLASGITVNASKISPAGVVGSVGPQGSPGVTGTQGVQGNQGSPGVTGAQGPTGSIGPQGSQGSPGVTGAQGVQGNQGSPGVTGAQGPTGSIGLQGNQGSPGVTGAQGIQGSPGVTGSIGPQGSPGVTGTVGQNAFNNTATFIQNNGNLVTVVSGAYAGWEQIGQAVFISTGGYYIVTGISGTNLVLANLASNLASGTTVNASNISPAGVVGSVGPQGNQGSPGVTGSQGIQGSPGVTGTQGAQGSPGVTGTQGVQGNQGSPGVTGSQGPTGSIGPQGNQGSPGVTGSQGPTGSIGPQGSQGSPGVTGTQGIQGSPGVTGPAGGGGGGTYASTTIAGSIYLTGDLQGKSSIYSGPTIQRITGDASGLIQIPSAVRMFFGGSIASASQTGFFNFPGFPDSLAPIISYMDNGNTIKVLQIGQNQGNGQQSIEIGNSVLGYMKINNSQWIDLTINDAPAVRIFGPQSPRLSMAGNIIEYDGEQMASGPARLQLISSSNFDIPANDLILNSMPPRAANSTNKSAGNIVLALAAPILPQGSYASVDILNGSSGGFTQIAEFGREAAGGAPYFGLWGPKTATGAMYFQVQTNVASYTLYWPNTAAVSSGFVLASDTGGKLFWTAPGAQGQTGVQGPTGPQGLAGASSFWVQNNGVTLGQFNTINLQGAFVGITGPGGNNVVSFNSLNDIAMMGVTGSSTPTTSVMSGAMVQWNLNFLNPTGTIGHTTIGTAAGWVTINKAGYYQVKTAMTLTGVPSGVSRIVLSQYIGATGGNGNLGFGSGSPIAQSAVVVTVASAIAYMSNDYVVYIGSGTSIETYVYKFGGGAATGIGGISPTGTYLEIRAM